MMTIFSVQSLSTENAEPCFFFPYDTCAVFRIKDTGNSKSKTPTMTVKTEAVLKGSLKCNQIIHLALDSKPTALFGAPSKQLVGSRQLLAFHQGPQKNKTILSTSNDYAPFKNPNFFDEDVARLEKNLKRTPYPYRSCLVVTLKEVHAKHEKQSMWRSKEFFFQIDSIVVADQKYREEGVKGFENAPAYKDQALEHFVFKPKDQIAIKVKWFPLSVPPPRLPGLISGRKYILQWNPTRSPGSQKPNTFSDSSFELCQYKPQKIEGIKEFARNNPQMIESLRRQLESHIEKRWTAQRIREYLKRPDLRECPQLTTIEPLNGPVLGGQLYKDLEPELGKVVWYTWLQDMQPVGEFQIGVTNKAGDVWRLETGYLELQDYSDDDFKRDLISLTLQRSYQAFWTIQNYKLSYQHEAIAPVDFPAPTTERLELIRDARNKIRSLRQQLANGKVLTADIDSDLHLSNILVDGKVCSAWCKAYKNRVEYMNEIWKVQHPDKVGS